MTRYLFTLLFFISITSFLLAEDIVLFPCNNTIYRYYQNSNILEKALQTDKYLSFDFYFINSAYYFIEKKSEELVLYKYDGRNLIKIYQGNFSNVILTEGFALFSGKTLNNKNEIDYPLFSFNNDKLKLLKIFSHNLIPDDFLFYDKYFIVSGSDRANNKNYVYQFNPNTLTDSKLLESTKKDDFLKLIADTNHLFCYNSSKPDGNSDKVIYRLYSDNKIEMKKSTGYYFFGKGFTANNQLYLPCIDNNKNTFIMEYKTDKKNEQFINTISGIYKIIKVTDSHAYYISYNFFKNRNQFYFVDFDIKKDKEDVILEVN